MRPLTAQQRQVAELVADGLSNKRIAALLGLSVGAVEQAIVRIAAKLGLGQRYARRVAITRWVKDAA